MAAKAGFKELLLRKGEKLALLGALGLFALLMVWGVVGAADAGNPDALAKVIEDRGNALQSKIKSDATKTEPLPSFATGGSNTSDFPSVAAYTFVHTGKPFEPIDVPSLRRDQPRVLTPVESQINYYAASYKAYDRQFTFKDGEVDTVRVGVLVTNTEKPADKEALTEFYKKSFGNRAPKSFRASPRPGTVKPQPGSPMIPGMPGGYTGVATAPGMTGSPEGVDAKRTETKVAYKSLEEATKLGLPPAVAIYPIRMAVIQLSFPLKAQLEEIRQALRLRTLWEARQESSPATISARAAGAGVAGIPGGPMGAVPAPPGGAVGFPPSGPMGPGGAGATLAAIDADTSPAFVGLVVERLIIPAEGLPANMTRDKYESLWEPVDHQTEFFNKFTLYDAPFIREEGYKPYFLRPEQGISSPLPVLADGFALNYPPDTSLGTIYANYKRLEDTKMQKKTADDAKKRYIRGLTNPYAPMPSTGGYNGNFGEDTARPGIGGMPLGMGGNFRPPVGGVVPMVDPDMTGVAGSTTAQIDPNKLDVDHLLMRFLDVKVVPGNTYQYRVKVLMKSPNYRNKDNVADNSIAAVETLESAWYDLPQTLSVPQESFLYAYSAKKYEESVAKVYEDSGKAEPIRKVAEFQEVRDGRRAVIQVQQWMERLLLQGTVQEPIGAWVQAEMPVAIGEFVGRKVPVELPLWRSAALNYVLPSGDTKTPIYPNWPKDNSNQKYTLPKMRVLDFRTKNVLVDFDGGHTNVKVGSGIVSDDSKVDLLIVREDGKIEVRSEARDMAENVLPNPPTPRAQRETAWNDWLARVRKLQDTEAAPGTAGTPAIGRPAGDGGR